MEKETRGFRQLTVWQRAYELTLEVYRFTKTFPKGETYHKYNALLFLSRQTLLKVTKEIIEKNIYSFCILRKGL